MISQTQIQELWQNTAHQVKEMNEDKTRYNLMIQLVSHINNSLSEVGFTEEQTKEMTLVMLNNLQVSSSDSDVTFMMIEEVIKSEIVQELSKTFKYLFDQFNTGNHSDEYIYKLISASLAVLK